MAGTPYNFFVMKKIAMLKCFTMLEFGYFSAKMKYSWKWLYLQNIHNTVVNWIHETILKLKRQINFTQNLTKYQIFFPFFHTVQRTFVLIRKRGSVSTQISYNVNWGCVS